MISPPLQNQQGWRFASHLSHATSLLFLCPSSKTSHRKPPPHTQHESHPLPLAHIVLSPRHGISKHHRQAPFQRHCSSMAQSCPALGNSDFVQVHNPVHHSKHIPPPRFSSMSVHEPLPQFQDECANPFAGRTDGCSSNCRDISSCVPLLLLERHYALPFIADAPLESHWILSQFQTSRHPREVVTARLCSAALDRRGGFLRQQKTNEQNDSVLLRFVKSFYLFF